MSTNRECPYCGVDAIWPDQHSPECNGIRANIEAMEAVAEKLQELIDRVDKLEQSAIKYRGHRHYVASESPTNTTSPRPSDR